MFDSVETKSVVFKSNNRRGNVVNEEYSVFFGVEGKEIS